SLLLGKEMDLPFISAEKYLFNDSALALHMPYADDNNDIASHTIATGQNAGWIWDIGLTHRCGVGHVYSSEFLGDDEAEANLHAHLGPAADDISPRKIKFKSGHRHSFGKAIVSR
ncbi:MAG: tryptophan 7-halogenase, partial [Arenicella sp.]|nr:tryptophan 7-halogenase [Arenicella sp.]